MSVEALGFALGLAGLLLAGSLFAAALRLRSPIAALLAAYLVASAIVVGLGEALSLVGLVGRRGYAVGELVALASGFAFWWIRGGPPLPTPTLRGWAARRHPILLALAIVVSAAIAYETFLVFATPPNNWDSMTYHLSRAAAWYQEGGIHYIANAHTSRQNTFPLNSELEILYTLAFLGNDRAAALPQLLAELALLLGVGGIARRIGFGRAASVFAALLTATLTQVALQATTTQNDLTVAALVVAAAYFLLGRNATEGALAGLALGLAVGTKVTASFSIPVLGVLALVALGRRGRVSFLASAIAATALFGSYAYVQNAIETGRLLGDARLSEQVRADVTPGGTASSVARMTYRFIDVSGFQRAAPVLLPVADLGEALFDVLQVPPNPPESTSKKFSFRVNTYADPDYSFFGPLGLFLVLPLAVGFGVAAARRRATAVQGTLAIGLFATMLAIALVYKYNDFVGRFLLVAVALCMPLAAVIYRRRVLAAGAAAVGCTALAFAHAHDVAKPPGVGGTVAVWDLSRPDAQGLTRFGMGEVIRAVERTVPRDARLGVLLGEDDWDYPLYGPELTRRLVPLPQNRPFSAAERLGLSWVAIGEGAGAHPPVVGWSTVSFSPAGWTLHVHRVRTP